MHLQVKENCEPVIYDQFDNFILSDTSHICVFDTYGIHYKSSDTSEVSTNHHEVSKDPSNRLGKYPFVCATLGLNEDEVLGMTVSYHSNPMICASG